MNIQDFLNNLKKAKKAFVAVRFNNDCIDYVECKKGDLKNTVLKSKINDVDAYYGHDILTVN